jgi:hypothetical protein
MADIPQLLTNYDALVGVALGAGLTYGFGALNRRHIEKRENQTRWYEQGFKHISSFPKLRMMSYLVRSTRSALEYSAAR